MHLLIVKVAFVQNFFTFFAQPGFDQVRNLTIAGRTFLRMLLTDLLFGGDLIGCSLRLMNFVLLNRSEFYDFPSGMAIITRFRSFRSLFLVANSIDFEYNIASLPMAALTTIL